MIVRFLTSAPLAGVGLLWLYLAFEFALDPLFKGHGILGSLLLPVAFPVVAGLLTLYSVWHLRARTGERAAARLMLAAVDAFCLFCWFGSLLGWGGGV